MEKLLKIQSELKAPKNNFNSFAKYNFRSCEDILEAVKPLLLKYNCLLTLTDNIESIQNRVYIRVVAKLIDIDSKLSIEVSAVAREPEIKKGFDESQITGASSSYARKYALSGLFLLDDNKDADNFDNSKKENIGVKDDFIETWDQFDKFVKSHKEDFTEEFKNEIKKIYGDYAQKKISINPLKEFFEKCKNKVVDSAINRMANDEKIEF